MGLNLEGGRAAGRALDGELNGTITRRGGSLAWESFVEVRLAVGFGLEREDSVFGRDG